MSTITILVRLKKVTQRKHNQWLQQQREFSYCVHHCIERILNGESLTSRIVHHPLKSTLKNEAIRRAKKAVRDVNNGRAKSCPTFKATLPVSVNNQNWDTRKDSGGWKIGFTTNAGKRYLPVVECEQVKTWFPFFSKAGGSFRGTIQLIRKGKHWVVAIPVQISCELKQQAIDTKRCTPIGIDLGLCHLAVVSEPQSGQRQFFSGKQVGYVRRHFRSLRRSLGKKKAQRALERVGQKESRCIRDYNRKLAQNIVRFAQKFPNPIIKLERLDDIRKKNDNIKRADRTIHAWAFYQLKAYIQQAAHRKGIPVVDINPYQTSQKCFRYKRTDAENRLSRDVFQCIYCGHRNHADLNAAKNIAASTILAV